MFNPQRFEHIYGVDALDTAHNFFPEMMYDSHLFPQPTLSWMRHRISSLFPSEYAQQNTIYRLYHSQQRAQMMDAWRTNRITHVPSPIPQTGPSATINTPLVITPNRTTRTNPLTSTPQRQTTMAEHLRALQTPPPIQRNTTNNIRTNEFISATDLSLLNSLLSLGTATTTADTNTFTNLMGGLNFVFEDVIVAPTQLQIMAGSQLVEHSAVPEEVNCAICQEHGEPRTWRLLHCHHYFHSSCISRWYEQSVECPVCRADIRNPPAAAAQASQSSQPVESHD